MEWDMEMHDRRRRFREMEQRAHGLTAQHPFGCLLALPMQFTPVVPARVFRPWDFEVVHPKDLVPLWV